VAGLESGASHSALPIRIGVSSCLLGDEVRYDGGHKRDRFVTDVLSHHVEWVPICPEVEAGFGTPREAMRLVGDPKTPQLIKIQTQRNMTKPLSLYTTRKLKTLEQARLSGYIFKKDSPSCGIERVKLFNPHGMPTRAGVGLFARAFKERFPLVPIEDEGRLCDPVAIILSSVCFAFTAGNFWHRVLPRVNRWSCFIPSINTCCWHTVVICINRWDAWWLRRTAINPRSWPSATGRSS